MLFNVGNNNQFCCIMRQAFNFNLFKIFCEKNNLRRTRIIFKNEQTFGKILIKEHTFTSTIDKSLSPWPKFCQAVIIMGYPSARVAGS